MKLLTGAIRCARCEARTGTVTSSCGQDVYLGLCPACSVRGLYPPKPSRKGEAVVVFVLICVFLGALLA